MRLTMMSMAAIALLPNLAFSQTAKPSAPCGAAKVHLEHPVYLTTSAGIFAVELPGGWHFDHARNYTYFFLKDGDTYQSARTLMYVHIEKLDVPFQKAVENDMRESRASCPEMRIEDELSPKLLETGCEQKTQKFVCTQKQNPYVDLATKISIGGLLLNVVLSADNEMEIARYRADYGVLVEHLALVTH